jgi:ABC-type uncharacterized transport system ATPase subunit
MSKATCIEADNATPRLELRGVSKSFPGIKANDSIDLTLMPGEIHALLGENGAGKSTLVKVVYGVMRADEGTIAWNGKDVDIDSPATARKLGIGLVFQHFSLFDSLTVAENIALGMEEKIPMRALAARIGEVSARYGLTLDSARHVHSLSVGERQRVEIVRCLLQNPSLLIMDEPTSVLTPQEVKLLFETLRRLASEGCSILYISHKLQEIRSLCSAATIMRGGRVVSSCDPRQETSRGLAEMMIGSELAPARYNDNKNLGVARLVVDHLSMKSDDPFGTNLKDISFDVRAGEIFGIAGVAGNGQIELLAALSGERCLIPGSHTILMDGKPVGHYGPRVRRERGLAFLPEERLGRGAVADMSLSENSLLGSYRREGLVERGFINSGELQTFAGQIINDYQVVARGTQSAAKNLSGGNLQKYMIGREILQNPGVLLAAHPTWGVDAGAAAAIHLALIALARSGSAILLVSEDLDELFAISNRLAVIQSGSLSRSMLTKDTSAECCGLLMGGVTGSVGEAATGA